MRRVKYITPVKKQMIGPKEAQCIESYRCTGHPDSGWQVDVTVQTPKVSISCWTPCFTSQVVDRKRRLYGMSGSAS